MCLLDPGTLLFPHLGPVPGHRLAPSADAANALPQALVLTAIVIGFSLIAFFAALALKAQRIFGTTDGAEMEDAERMGSPFTAKGEER